MVRPTEAGTPAQVSGVPVKVHPTPANMVDTVVTPAGETKPGNYPTFDKSTPRTVSTAVKAVPGAITPQGGRTAFITEVVGVADVDTFTVKDPNSPTGEPTLVCRLNRVDGPETAHAAREGKLAQPAQAFGEESKDWLKNMVLNKQVTVTVTQLYDKFGKRSVCELEINGNNMSDAALKGGMAWAYRTFGRNSVAPPMADQLAEAKARADGVGLFAFPGYEYPGNFKRRMDARNR